MKIEQTYWTVKDGWQPFVPYSLGQTAQLVLAFGSRELLESSQWFEKVRAIYETALIFGCSTAGEIFDTQVLEGSIVITAIQFEHTQVKGAKVNISNAKDSAEAGEKLAKLLLKEDLKHVFVLSEGLNINGSDLVKGLCSVLPQGVSVTGGLSSDGVNFQKTYVLLDDYLENNAVVGVGFYGSRLKVSYASASGFDAFGPERLITKASGKILYELDNKSALALYKNYLGEYAKDLPASGLFFPLNVCTAERDIVRTIFSMDENDCSLTFAGDIPQGAYGRLMKGNYANMVQGAEEAAKISYKGIGDSTAQLAILVTCVGRKLIMRQRVEEEVEAVRGVIGNKVIISGFYSYGEISPFCPGEKCKLHNQTMTITIFTEN